MQAFVIRIIKQLINDLWTVILLFIAPCLVMLLVWLILGGGGNNSKSAVAVFGLPPEVMKNLQNANIDMIELENIDNIDSLLISGAFDIAVYRRGITWTVRSLEASAKHISLLNEIQNAMIYNLYTPFMVKLNVEFVYDSTNMFNSLAYMFLGVVTFIFAFMFSGISFVREYLNQTLERLLLTSIKPYQIVGGYMLGYGVISIIQGIIIILFAVHVLDVPLKGSMFLCILILALIAFSAVAIGNIISTFTNNESQVMQIAPLVLIPQIFFSGLIPLENIHPIVALLRYLMPIYYGCAPLKEVMNYGAGFSEIFSWLVYLLFLIIIVYALNSLTIKKIKVL